MSQNYEKTDDFIEAVSGRYAGEETLVADPSSGATLTAMAEFHNESALNGAGLRAAYRQTVDGAPSMAAETVYRFGDDGGVMMVWTPAKGDPQIYTGARDGAVIRVERQDDQGMTHIITADYSESGAAACMLTSDMAMPGGGEPMRVFTGHYTRQD